MGLRINHNLAALKALRNSAESQIRLKKDMSKLASGQEISSAADGAAKLSLSEQLKGQIAGLNQAISNSEASITVVQVAESNLNEINRHLIDIRQNIVHAANTGVNDQISREADQKSIDNALESITSISEQTRFGKKKLLDGSLASRLYVKGKDLELVSITSKTKAPCQDGYEVRILSPPSKPRIYLNNLEQMIGEIGSKILEKFEKIPNPDSPFDLTKTLGKTLMLKSDAEEKAEALSEKEKASLKERLLISSRDGTNQIAIDIGIDDINISDYYDPTRSVTEQVRAFSRSIGKSVKTDDDSPGSTQPIQSESQLKAAHSNYDFMNFESIRERIANNVKDFGMSVGKDRELEVTEAAKGRKLFTNDLSYYYIENEESFLKDNNFSISSSFNDTKVDSTLKDIQGTINGEKAIGKGDILTGAPDSLNVAGLSVRFTGEIDEDVEEGYKVTPEGGEYAGMVYGSINPLKIQIGSQYGQKTQLFIESVNTENLAKDLYNKSGFRNLREISVRSQQEAHDALLLVDKAIDQVSSMRGDLGSFQKNTLESNLANLRVAGESLLQSESGIRTVDVAAKTASFVRNQISNQSALSTFTTINKPQNEILNLLT